MRRFVVFVFLGALALGVGAGRAEARSFRVSQVPSGGQFGCGLCHEGGRGGAPRNPFGRQVEASLSGDLATANVTWAALVNLDADGDEYSNGEELGDPTGAWRIGDPPPQRNTGDPNNPDSFPQPCGNAELEDGEDCDRSDLNGESCESLGFIAGRLRCAIDCTYDTTACSNCGDGTLNGREQCDGADLGGATCQSRGFGRGELSCNANCELDTSLCSDCGNGTRDGAEACDGPDLDGQSCLTRGFDGGTLGCDADCGFDVSACEGDPALVCGDGIRSNAEECDGADVGGASCGSRGLGEGELGCRIDCTVDLGGCTACGNGAIDPGEDCDGDELGGMTCGELGFEGGALACEGCRFATDGCEGGAAGNNGAGNNGAGNNGGSNGGAGSNNGGAGDGVDGTSGGDEGCSVAPGRAAPGVLVLWALGAWLWWRRR